MIRSQRNEAGFTVVEVIIAVIVLAAVASSVALASVGSSTLRGTAKLQAAITASGLQVQEDIATNRAWMDRPGCRNTASYCDVSDVVKKPNSLILAGVGTSSAPAALELVQARATPIDSEVDLTGPADKDGVIPDFFRIDVRVRVPTTVATRFNSTQARLTRDLTTTIDRRGREQTGSLAVEICQVTNQSDERMSIQGCGLSGASGVKMAGCPLVPRAGCVPAFGWIANLARNPTEPTPHVMLKRILPGSVSYTVRNTTTGQTWSSGSAKVDAGLAIFQDLPAGGYQILGLPSSLGGGSERWATKEIPAFHGSSSAPTGGETAIVEAGLRNRALVMFRPGRTTTGQITIVADREVHDYTLFGPLSGSEVVVDPGTPTTTYQGGAASSQCDFINSEARMKMTCVLEPGPGANCASIYVTGFEFVEVAEDTGDWQLQMEGPVNVGAGYGNYIQKPVNHARYATYCTTYDELHTYTFYNGSGAGPGYILPGAVEGGAVKVVRPAPDNRVIDIGAGTLTSPKGSCVSVHRGQCGGIAPLVPGLNTGMFTESGAAQDAANTNMIGYPSWLTAGGLWVRTDGRITSSTGQTVGPNPVVKIRGRGECYWKSPRYGKAEGPCNQCQPLWAVGNIIYGCSILTNDDVVRTVKERHQWFDLFSGAVIHDVEFTIAVDNYSIPFAPPWRCAGSTPSLRNKTCSRQATGGGGAVSNKAGTYTSSQTGGVATVDSAPFVEGGA
ncbi:MAG: hypothetical protein JWN72_1927 [Thermoleophilia bacterium]|nr:hypothetical protein [Thermoleophilia bacterium]